jgi:quercetin dioxygenase-like cupin family protein
MARVLQYTGQERHGVMTMNRRLLINPMLAIGLSGFALAALPPPAGPPPDPLVRYPDNYKVIVENDRVRVLDFKLRKGATEEFHRHPANVAVFLGEFRIRFSFPDGHTAIRDAHAGDVGYSDAVVHASQNIGDTDAHGILIELKDAVRR